LHVDVAGVFGFGIDFTHSIACGTFHHKHRPIFLSSRQIRAGSRRLLAFKSHRGLIFPVPTFTALVSFAWSISTAVSYPTHRYLIHSLAHAFSFVSLYQHIIHSWSSFFWVYREGIGHGREGRDRLHIIGYMDGNTWPVFQYGVVMEDWATLRIFYFS
jgi:hypothetical protein